MRTINMYLLKEKCIIHHWFESGSVHQYNKLFQRNDEGASLEELATIIWICSNGHKREDILHELNSLKDNAENFV